MTPNNTKPFARSYAIVRKPILPGIKYPHAASQSYAPLQICAAYNWPTGVDVSPLTIVIGELGGSPPSTSDISEFVSRAGIPRPIITTHLLPGGNSSPSDADGEVALDWQLAVQVWSYMTGLPANIHIVYGPNSGQAFADVMNYASGQGANKFGAGSWSWGQGESSWSGNDKGMYDRACLKSPIPWCSASGDNDSNDGTNHPEVDFPSASPYNIGCGGTSRVPSGGTEIVWNNGGGEGTGGGFSRFYPKPIYQPANSQSPQGGGRMVPDWAAVADPSTGYSVLVNGQWGVIGGTSAVAPLMAGFLAVVNGARLKKGLPLLNGPDVLSRIWNLQSSFLDVTNGNNGSYRASIGPDPCSGLGRPLPALFAELITDKIPTPTPTPTPIPTPIPTPTPDFSLDFSQAVRKGQRWYNIAKQDIAVGKYDAYHVITTNDIVTRVDEDIEAI